MRKIVSQIWNEKGTNVSLFIQLWLVSIVLWFVVDFLYVRYKAYSLPRGFDISHCYKVKIGELPDYSPDYQSDFDNDSHHQVFLLQLLDQLRMRSDIEAVSLSTFAHPYGSIHANGWRCADTTAQTNFRIRSVTPDFIQVFQYRGERGESSERLAEIMRTMPDEAILAGSVSQPQFAHKSTSDYIGMDFYQKNDSLVAHPLVAAVAPVRYHDFSTGYTPFILMPLKKEAYQHPDRLDICLRVKPEHDVDFINRFMKDAALYYRNGNLFLANAVSFRAIGNSYQKDEYLEIRNYLIGIGFLLFNVFLGLLGIFWFRTQRRRSEIALHKAFGSTRGQVFGRLILEGLILLTFATLPALLIDYNIAHLELTEWDGNAYISASRFLITTGITWLLMALMIIGGIWFPARKAMKIEPAQALHEE